MTSQHFSAAPRSRRVAASIEWEELPSLYDSLSGRLAVEAAGGRRPTTGTAWTETVPADLEPRVESGPLREAMHGLATREVLEPEIFRYFFGAPSRA